MKPIETLEPYQKRVHEENKALSEKITALEVFTYGEKFQKLDDFDQQQLRKQLAHMMEYSNILRMRVAKFRA